MSIQTSFTNKSVSTFSPASIPNLEYWLDATDTATIQASGTSVTTWENKGNRTFTSTPTGTITTGSTWNGLNYLSVPNGSTMNFTSAFSLGRDQTSVVVIRSLNEIPVGSTLIRRFSNNSGLDYYGIRRSTNGAPGVFQMNLSVCNISRIETIGTDSSLGPTDPRPREGYGSVLSYCAITDTRWLNPANIATVCGSPPLRLGNESTSGGFRTVSVSYSIGDTGTSTVSWHVFEIMRYARALNETERQAVEGYIAWKYFMRTSDEQNFTPSTLSNCVLWLDAGFHNDFSSNFTGTSNAITSWLDKSGNSNHVTFSNAGNAPYYSISSAGGLPSDMPTLTMSTSSDTIECRCPLSIDSTTPVTMFAVVQPPPRLPFTSNTILSLNCYPGTRGNQIALIADSALSRYVLTGGTVGTVGNSNSFVPSNPRYDILSGHWSPSSSQLFYAAAGTPPSANAPASLRANSSALIAGNTSTATDSTTVTNRWTGRIQEIIVYNRTLTENERKLTERYLANKWLLENSTTTRYDHPFRTVPPYQRRFDPPQIPGSRITFWIDAMDGASYTLNGSNVDTITDKSSDSNALTIGGTVVYNTTIMNNRPSFDLSAGRIMADNLVSPISNSATVMFLGYLSNRPVANRPAVGISKDGTTTGVGEWRVNDYSNLNSRNAFSNTNLQLASLDSVYCNAPYIWGGSLGPLSNGTNYLVSAFLNDGCGNTFTNSTSTLVPTSLGSLRVGGHARFGSSNTYPGYIGEVIVYNTPLTYSDMRRVSAYFCEKWDLPASYSRFSYYKPQGLGSTTQINDPTFLRSSTIVWLDANEPYASRYQPGPTLNSPIARWENKSTILPASGFTTGLPMLPGGGSVTYTLDGSYPAMYFDGTSYLRSWNIGNLTTATFSIVVVGRTTQSGSQYQRMFHDFRAETTSPLRYHYIDAQSSNGSFGAVYDAGAPVSRYSSNYTASTRAGIHIINQSGATQPTLFLNGSSVAIGVSSGTVSGTNFTSNDAGRLYLGAGFNFNSNAIAGYLTGYIYEVIITNEVLSTLNRERLEGHLAWKWGIADLLPSSHPYKKVIS